MKKFLSIILAALVAAAPSASFAQNPVKKQGRTITAVPHKGKVNRTKTEETPVVLGFQNSANTLKELYVTGDGVEGVNDVAMKPLPRKGAPQGRYVAYVPFKQGSFMLRGVTGAGKTVTFGDGKSGKLKQKGKPMKAKHGLAKVIVDVRDLTIKISPVKSVTVHGSVLGSPRKLNYDGAGIFTEDLKLDQPGGEEYLKHNIWFVANDKDTLMRVPGTRGLAMKKDGLPVEKIRVNPGEYRLVLDLAADTFALQAPVDINRISVFGSSVANGQGAPGKRGYAFNYGEQLRQRSAAGVSKYPLYTSGVAIGGNTTRHLLDRYDDMIRDHGLYVLIGLSLGNEGIHGAQDPEKVFAGFRDNMQTLIARIRADGKIPVVVNNYTRGDYNEQDYSYVKRMNMLIHQWDVPSVNVLGAIDDGHGKWSEGFIDDIAHPNLEGHQEFMYAFPPSLFDALREGKCLPRRATAATTTSRPLTLSNGAALRLYPEGKVHPFTLHIRVKGQNPGQLFQFTSPDNPGARASLTVNADSTVTYRTLDYKEVPVAERLGEGWHDIELTHYHARGETRVYIDGREVAVYPERISLGETLFGDITDSRTRRDFAEVAFWRSGMNPEEMAALHEGKMLNSSLEIYSPLSNNSRVTASEKAVGTNGVSSKKTAANTTADQTIYIPNLALSLNSLTYLPPAR